MTIAFDIAGRPLNEGDLCVVVDCTPDNPFIDVNGHRVEVMAERPPEIFIAMGATLTVMDLSEGEKAYCAPAGLRRIDDHDRPGNLSFENLVRQLNGQEVSA